MLTAPVIPLYVYLLTILLMVVLQVVWNIYFLRLVRKHYRKLLSRQKQEAEISENEVKEVAQPVVDKPETPLPEPQSSYFPVEEKPMVEKSKDERLLEKTMFYIEKNLSKSDFSVEELSSELGMSRVHLYKRILAITGKTPLELIRSVRMKRAARYLSVEPCTVTEVALKVGINNPKIFSKYFKEEFGVLPSVYQVEKKKG